MHGNGRPLGMRKRMQLLIAVVLLAWATQTLLHQWGYGAEVPMAAAAAGAAAAGGEKFVPGTARYIAGATLELRGDATVIGSDVKLRQICRWSDADAPVFAPVADLVIARIKGGSPFRTIRIEEIRGTLHDAGVNLAIVKFAGPLACTVNRGDAEYNEQNALRLWAEAKEEDAGTRGRGDAEAQKEAGGHGDKGREVIQVAPQRASASAPRDAKEPVRSLGALLVSDLAVRLGLPEEQLQVSFNPKDEKLLNLSEPLFRFNIDGRQIHDLGPVTWNVLVVAGGGSQKGVITANARAWQHQVVVCGPLAFHQVIRARDVTEQRVLVERMPYEPLLTASQIIGQQAARELRVGSVISARMVDAVPLVTPGQLVTVSLSVGSVTVKTVGRAMEAGSYGQTVKVRNDATRDVFDVTLTGPQEGTMGPLPSPSKVASADSR